MENSCSEYFTIFFSGFNQWNPARAVVKNKNKHKNIPIVVEETGGHRHAMNLITEIDSSQEFKVWFSLVPWQMGAEGPIDPHPEMGLETKQRQWDKGEN